ncbi:PREDICTED: uncharacterized protein LOC105571117 [Vollenhovia emeryi]|uniref:uncharacterized protein LOC105571117 n=1 Tax=Vollenhovia emeryi TaxID=411798 RepID=UPI0005F4FBAB|nr:PREDICTED: uncharacterized protein LOC105571117 [Vollenhovia emeryi]
MNSNDRINQALQPTYSTPHPKKQRLVSKQLSISKHTKALAANEEIDLALAKFFFGCNISFNVVESQYFKNFVKLLLPTYKPPTRKKLSTNLLDKVYQTLLAERVSSLGSDGVLLIDGWKNSSANTKNVVCTIHTVNSKCIFLKSWDLTGLKETGDQLKEIVDEGKKLAKEKFNITTYAVVSDNASAMISMGKKVDIWHTTCHSHSGNLLAKAFVPETFAKEVNNLLRAFKTPGAEYELKQQGGSRIILACDTRWCSYRDAFRCLLQNLCLMQTLVAKKKVQLDSKSENLLKDPSFAMQLQDFILIFDPICQLINVCQQSNCSIAEGCEEWLKLQIPTVNDEMQQKLDNRLNKVLTPIVLTSNFLHPQYRAKRFLHDEQKMKMVFDFLKQELNLQFITDEPGLDSYQKNLGIFEKLQKRNITLPETFWITAEPFCPHLSSLAQRLLKIPAASAQLERLFSFWAFVHSDLRNRLTVDRSMKLVDIYYTLKMNEYFDDYYDDLVESD